MVAPSTGLPPTDQSNPSVPALSAEHQNAGSEEMKSDLEREEEGGRGGGREEEEEEGGRRRQGKRKRERGKETKGGGIREKED